MERPPFSTRLLPQLRDRNGKGQSRIVIPLSSRPCDYKPGSGPPLQRLCLLPPNDSTAYIVERILLPSPGLAADRRPLPKRMTYIVGWRDLPAARLLVPAMKVLDYVSPKALEEWEWNMEKELDDERQKLAEDRQKLEPVKAAGKKARPPAHTAIESAIVADPETAAQTHPKMGTMSLSTPQKPRLEDFDEGLWDDDEEDEDEGSPTQQLARETGWTATPRLLDGMEVGTEDDGVKHRSSDAQKSILAAPRQLASGWASDAGGFDDPLDLIGEVALPTSTPGHSALPFNPDSATQSPSGKSSKFSRLPPLRPSPLHSMRTPTDSNGGFVSLNANGASRASPRTIARARPSDPPRSSQRGLSAGKQAVEANRAFPDTLKPAPTSKRQSSGKQSKQPTPSRRTPAKGAKQKSKPILYDDNGEPIWEVKRIENMEMYEVESRGLVRYFQVRWEGDWPPDQNPTWEPEENLPENLVRNYFKRGSQKRKRPSRASEPASAQKAPKLKPLEKPTLSVGKQYSSVSGAFSGEFANEDALGPGNDDDAGGNEHVEERGHDYEENERVIVDEGHTNPAQTGWTAANGHPGRH